MPAYGQLVVGAPGSGKSTYCTGMQQMCQQLGRNVILINLDPGNEQFNTPAHSTASQATLRPQYDINISMLITIDDVQQHYQLGPNGSFLYCMEYLLHNIDWLCNEIDCVVEDKESVRSQHIATQQQQTSDQQQQQLPPYLIIDLPGQVELYTHHHILRSIVHHKQLQELFENGLQLTAVHLVDSIQITDINRYISSVLLSLNIMVELELPHVNVFSKIDLLKHYTSRNQQLSTNLQFYTDVIDIYELVEMSRKNNSNAASLLNNKKYNKLTSAICELIDNYSMVNFTTLDVTSKSSMLLLLKKCDKANGYTLHDDLQQFMSENMSDSDVTQATLNSVARSDVQSDYERVGMISEQFAEDIGDDDESDELAAESEKIQIALAKAAEKQYEEQQKQR